VTLGANLQFQTIQYIAIRNERVEHLLPVHYGFITTLE